MSRLAHSTEPKLGQGLQARRPSVVSSVSGIADSTISFGTLVTGESLRLSQFPPPPRYTPLSPIQSEFGSTTTHTQSQGSETPPATPGTQVYSGSNTPTSARLTFHQRQPVQRDNDASSGITASTMPNHRGEASSPYAASQSSYSLSPYDWHEGASSIDVDATEDRLLSTSFITQLLQENPEPSSYSGRHLSDNSDKLSAVSELTYPPAPHRTSSQYVRRPPYLPQGGRPPPSAFSHLNQMGNLTVNHSDSDTLASTGDVNRRPALRTASLSRSAGLPSACAVGVVPATLRTISPTDQTSGSTTVDTIASSSAVDTYKSLTSNDEVDEKFLAAYKYPDSAPYGTAIPSTATFRRGFPDDGTNADSRKSEKDQTSRPSSSSAKSIRSIRRAFDRLRVKPLPPVPTKPSQSLSAKSPGREFEEDMPLPQLAHRADTLSRVPEKGYHPHRSMNLPFVSDGGDYLAKPQLLASAFDDPTRENSALELLQGANMRRTPRSRFFGRAMAMITGSSMPGHRTLRAPKKVIPALLLLFTLLLIIVAIAIGVTIGRRNHNSLPNCPGNFTGATCNLDATCVCTSSSSSCGPLARHLVSLQPTMNSLFDANYTTSSLATAFFLTQGDPRANDCASQAMLVDIGPVLTSNTPNRTQWVQSALLWNLVQSQDANAVETLRSFVLKAPWDQLSDSDGPVRTSAASFTAVASGFQFDFASQTVLPQADVTFADTGQPTSSQLQRVDSTARAVLDHMYTYAVASSTQRRKSLENYWQSVLQQKLQDLPVFLSIISTSPMLLPFDAAAQGSHSILPLLPNSSGSFPPPAACYPALTSTQIDNINALETSIFGLPAISTTSKFSSSCFLDRPIYGVLDVLQLRLPFFDTRVGVAKQAIVLNREVTPRVVVYNGETLSALPSADGTLPLLNPRNYGTLNNFKHIMLKHLSSIPDVNVAIALVQYVLSSPAVPPTNASLLYSALPSIPTLEIAVFGTVQASDVSSVTSSFSTPSNSLFFGSEAGRTLRNWAIGSAGSTMAWTELATSSKVVRDTSFTDATFNQTWLAASSNIATANVSQVVASFTSTNKFTP